MRKNEPATLNVCHAQNGNCVTQYIILFVSVIVCLPCTTLSYNKHMDWSYRWLLHHNHSTLTSFVLQTAAENRRCGQRKLTASGCDQPQDITVPTKGHGGMKLWKACN